MPTFLRIGDRVVNLDLIVACHRETSRIFVHYWPGNTWSYKVEEGGRELWDVVSGRADLVYNEAAKLAPHQG